MSGTMYSREGVLRAYAELGALREACERTGCPPYIAYIWLKKARALKPDEATRYGTDGAKLGALAEKEFQRLVPEAMSANGQLQKNCPSFDFDIRGITVDVKYSSITSRGAWQFVTAKHKELKPDFFAVFCALTEKGLDGGYRLFLIPAEFTDNTMKICFTPGNEKNPVFDYEVEPRNLAKTFALMAESSGSDKKPAAQPAGRNAPVKGRKET
ncbi:MAG: hypothetical protein LBC99_01980 [Spirochaetota bacterium]|nr:hypothetical protein [Spirochaetota bacterium]